MILKHFKNSIHTSRMLSKNSERNRIVHFFYIFIVRFFFSFHFFRSLFRPKEIYQNYNENELFLNEINSKYILRQLIDQGISEKFILKKDLTDKLTESVRNDNVFLDLKPFNEDENINLIKNFSFEKLDDIVDFTVNNNIAHLTINYKNNNEVIQKFGRSKFFETIVSNYLGRKNFSFRPHIYISNFKSNISELTKMKNAQYFHYDCDYVKFLKVFIYLNDVDSNNGPHVYIKNSHKHKKLKHILAERISDKEIEESYKSENITTVQGQKGSLFFEDTFGLHKGIFPYKTRILLVLEYGIGKDRLIF